MRRGFNCIFTPGALHQGHKGDCSRTCLHKYAYVGIQSCISLEYDARVYTHLDLKKLCKASKLIVSMWYGDKSCFLQ